MITGLVDLGVDIGLIEVISRIWDDGGYWVVQARVEMVTIEEAVLLGCPKCGYLFQGQNRDFQRAALAGGLLRVCETREGSAFRVDALDELFC